MKMITHLTNLFVAVNNSTLDVSNNLITSIAANIFGGIGGGQVV